MDAICNIQYQLHPTRHGRSSVNWIIEGDIKACFDNVDHHILLNRVRSRIGDRKVIDLIRAFLKAGVMAEGTVRHPVAGTPQGGIISPLLANVYLQAIDERYRRWIPSPNEKLARAGVRRRLDRKESRPTFYLVRYADDFVICVGGSREDAEKEKADLAQFLRETLHMELSLEKSLITDPADGFEFLGYRIVREASRHTGLQVAKTRIPKAKLQLIRDRLKRMTDRSTTGQSLEALLRAINRVVTGWRNYFRFAVGAWKEFMRLDWWLWQRVQIWLRKKHPKATAHAIRRQYSVIDRGRNTWGEADIVLKPFRSGPSEWYRNRGTRISNGWNDSIDNVTFNLKVAELSTGYTTIGETLR
jgi:group II intron reverse transcriptase/maturase